MADKPQDDNQEEPVVEEATPEEPQVEEPELEPEEEAIAEETEETPEEPAEPAEPEAEPPISRRKAKRIEKLERLVSQLKGKPEPTAKPEGIDYTKLIDTDPEVYEQLNEVSKEYGQAQHAAGLQEAQSIRFHTRLEIDAPRVEAKYPQFDKNSQEFNPALTSAINEWYLANVGYDPKTDTVQNANVRYADFVEGIMDLADAMAGAKTTKTVENITKQAASTGLRPSGAGSRPMDLSKDPSQMTNEELDAAINATMPRDSKGRFTVQK